MFKNQANKNETVSGARSSLLANIQKTIGTPEVGILIFK
jgi:hypothetical protein